MNTVYYHTPIWWFPCPKYRIHTPYIHGSGQPYLRVLYIFSLLMRCSLLVQRVTAILRQSFVRRIQDTLPEGKFTTRLFWDYLSLGEIKTHCRKASSQLGFFGQSFVRRIQDTLPEGKFTTRLFWDDLSLGKSKTQRRKASSQQGNAYSLFCKANPIHIAARQNHNMAILIHFFARQSQDTLPQGNC
jgi:hypothetical protein